MGARFFLEERSCRCGCGKKFKTLPTSRAFYASVKHDPTWNFTFGWGGVETLVEKEEKFLETDADPNQIEDCYF